MTYEINRYSKENKNGSRMTRFEAIINNSDGKWVAFRAEFATATAAADWAVDYIVDAEVAPH